MPKFYELYGYDVDDKSNDVINFRKQAFCPFTDSTCDGGGNRHQTKINLSKSPLRNFFDRNLSSVVPGVCSIQYGGDVWIVCPRRLLGFSLDTTTLPEINKGLKQHEKQALIRAGLPIGRELGVWAEVYLQYEEDDTSINYHFDFVIAPIIRNLSFSSLLEKYSISDDESEDIKDAARKGGYITGRFSNDKPLTVIPDLDQPFIIEVMTASTSGSDKNAGTDIASAFEDAILRGPHNCPGINKRQVWGRMATQLFSKSALAESWGGKTIWIVQDQLLNNIELTTKLQIDKTKNDKSGTINLLSMRYLRDKSGPNSVVVKDYVEKASGLDFSGNMKCTDILLPKVYPPKTLLLKAVLRRRLSARLKL